LAGSVRERFMRSGEVLVHRGDPGASMMVVLEGEARVELPDSSGTSLVLQVLRAGEAFGELALFDGKPPQCGRRGCDKWPATDFRAPRGA
jgi:CRP-like cAMP-binding protein